VPSSDAGKETGGDETPPAHREKGEPSAGGSKGGGKGARRGSEGKSRGGGK
jgi:hypothetical protein